MTRTRKIALAFTGLIVAAGVYALVATLRHGFSARAEPTALEAWIATQMRHLAVPKSGRSARNPVPLTEETLTDARSHFADHCASCHGNDGKGQTAIGQNLYPRAPDMTASRTQSLSDGELFYTIKNGVRMSGMPAWGEDGPEDDRESWQLVHFIRHLPNVTTQELDDMKRMNPRTPEEIQREEEETRFLEGTATPDDAPPEHHH